MPSEEEIRQKCLEFQSGWSEEERSKRVVGGDTSIRAVEIRVIPDSCLGDGSVWGGSGDEGPTIEDLTDMGTSGD